MERLKVLSESYQDHERGQNEMNYVVIKNSIVNVKEISMVECVEDRLLITFRFGTTKLIRLDSEEECRATFDDLFKQL